MKFQAKTYKRTGAMIGAILGVLSMLIAISAEKNMLGAILMAAFVCMGTVIGSIMERKYS